MFLKQVHIHPFDDTKPLDYLVSQPAYKNHFRPASDLKPCGRIFGRNQCHQRHHEPCQFPSTPLVFSRFHSSQNKGTRSVPKIRQPPAIYPTDINSSLSAAGLQRNRTGTNPPFQPYARHPVHLQARQCNPPEHEVCWRAELKQGLKQGYRDSCDNSQQPCPKASSIRADFLSLPGLNHAERSTQAVFE